jgi:predicted nucleic acid-binding Zn ribbon protein
MVAGLAATSRSIQVYIHLRHLALCLILLSTTNHFLLKLTSIAGKLHCSKKSGAEPGNDDESSDSDSEDSFVSHFADDKDCVSQGSEPICAACTFENKLGANHCEICGTALKIQSATSDQNHQISVGGVSQVADPICSACTFENKPSVSHCEICGTALKMQSATSGENTQILEGHSTSLCQPHLNQLSIDLFLERLLLPIRDTIGADTSPSASLPSFMSEDAYVRFYEMDVSTVEARQIINIISQQSSDDSSWADREIVQEQQQEREEQKEVQVFQVVQPQGDRDPQRECSWQVMFSRNTFV